MIRHDDVHHFAEDPAILNASSKGWKSAPDDSPARKSGQGAPATATVETTPAAGGRR